MDYKSPEPTKKGSATMPSTQVPVPGTFFYESEAAKASQETWSSCSNTQTAMQYLCLPVPACHYHGNSDTSGNSLPSRPHLNKEYCTIKLVIKKNNNQVDTNENSSNPAPKNKVFVDIFFFLTKHPPKFSYTADFDKLSRKMYIISLAHWWYFRSTGKHAHILRKIF